MLLDNAAHAGQGILNVGTIRNLLSREFVPAETAGQVCPKLEFPQPDLEQFPAVRAWQINPYARVILKQTHLSCHATIALGEAWQ